MTDTIRLLPDRWEADLAPLGFKRGAAGTYRRDGTTLTRGAAWFTLETAGENANDDLLMGHLGRPGLWKPVRRRDGVRHVFDLAAAALSPGPEEEEEAPARACLRWALETAAGGLPARWAPPPRDEVEGWLPLGRLTLHAGPLVRQGELVHTPDRLALRFPILTAVPKDLPAERRAWLHELLADAQDRWRLVRVGLDGGGAVAEVDLSGCPAAALEVLFRTGLDALRWVVGWLVESADFLADAAAASQALEVCRVRA